MDPALCRSSEKQIPANGTFVTVYRDNLWSHPVCRTMRADIGWLCEPGQPVPKGMRKTFLPGGSYATTRFVDRDERTAAWSRMWGKHSQSNSAPSDRICYDEYRGWPLPFENVKTRLHVRLEQTAVGKIETGLKQI